MIGERVCTTAKRLGSLQMLGECILKAPNRVGGLYRLAKSIVTNTMRVLVP